MRGREWMRGEGRGGGDEGDGKKERKLKERDTPNLEAYAAAYALNP